TADRKREPLATDRDRAPSHRPQPAAADRKRETLATDRADTARTGRRPAKADDAIVAEKVNVEAEETPKTSSISLWHKIFGLPADQTAKLADARPSDEEAREASEAEAPAGPFGGGSSRTAEVAREMQREVEADAGTDETRIDESTEEPGRDRPRRRRRGGRRTSKQRERGAEDRETRPMDPTGESGEEAFDEGFGFDDEFGGEPARREEPTDSEISAEVADDDLGIDQEAPSQGARPASHRGIPSWEEAIGTIVDLNLQSRAQRKQTPASSSRQGSSRGRPRGRRRNKP
ncbi:MAG: hypothetical protein L0Z07_05710, partial [Planctomycetes bacterium]|nr:hypothetical protein [Planctomycetota bacterium]